MGEITIYTVVSTTEKTTLNQKLRLEEYSEYQKWEFELFEEVGSTRKTDTVKACNTYFLSFIRV